MGLYKPRLVLNMDHSQYCIVQCALHCIMKIGHCKSVALVFIVMVQLCSMTPVMACWYCPPATKPPQAPKMPPSVPKLPPSVPELPPPVSLPPPSVPKLPPISLPPPSVPKLPPCVPELPPPVSLPPPPSSETCPLDALKLGACVDVLSGLVHIGIGDPSVNKCCPVLQGLLAVEAALCLCTTIKLNLLNINIAIPLAMELLVSCGLTPPPGFTCPASR